MSSEFGIFFAFEGGHQENIDSINAGISGFNKHQSTYRAMTWQGLDISGSILNASVLKAIDDCQVFACDLTYLNHNVMFELGYAIGKGKELLVLLNPSIDGAKDEYESSRLVRNIGYTPFSCGPDVLRALQQHRFKHETSITQLIDSRAYESDTIDLLYLESPVQSQASLELKTFLAQADGQVIINDTTEVEYQTLSWYITSLVKARMVVVHLLGQETVGRDLYNGEYSFYAGIAAGLCKRVMLIAPEPFRAPIDYSDILVEYDSSNKCVAKVAGWYDRQRIDLTDSFQLKSAPERRDKKTNLLQLGVGYEMAEEESELLSYFVEIETYTNALRRSASIITGRKGAGKTALFLKLSDEFSTTAENSFTIVLRPESDELIADVELTSIYQSPGSRQAFLTAVWKFVILSRLLEKVAEITRNLPSFGRQIDRLSEQVVQFAERNADLLRDGHFSFIARLYRDLDENHGRGNQRALESLYHRYISPTQDLLRDYFARHRFAEINVLADNLDKTWDAQHGLDLQSDMVLSLISFNDRIPIELGCDTLKPHTIVFLRNDIFEYVLDRAREPDKLVAKKLEIDWHRFPNKLRELIDARIRHSLDRGSDETVDDVWREYFRFSGKKHPFDELRSVLVSRPRDFIFVLSKMFESALNRDVDMVEAPDFDYALEAYSNYLYRNMIAETRARFPEIVAILKAVQSWSQTGSLEYRDFQRLLSANGVEGARANDLIEFLYDKDYIFAFYSRSGKVIAIYSEFDAIRKERRFWFLPKHRLSVQIHPNRSRLSGRTRSIETFAGT